MVLDEWIRCSHYLLHRVLCLRSRQKYLLLDSDVSLLWLVDSTASAHNAQARTSCSRFSTMVAQLVRPKVCQPHNQEDGRSVLGFLEGASNAFFHADEQELVWTSPPAEWLAVRVEQGLSDQVGWQLKKQLYGRRGGPRAFNDFVERKAVENWGMERCLAQPCFFVNRARHIMMELHQDDFYMTGPAQELVKLKEEMKQDVMLKCSPLLFAGSRWSHLKTLRARTSKGLFIRANARYAEEVIKSLGLQKAKAVPTPMVSDTIEGDATEKLVGDHCIS